LGDSLFLVWCDVSDGAFFVLSAHLLSLILKQGVNDLNSLFDPQQEDRRTGALSELGVQYAGSNGTIPTRDRWGNYNAATRMASSGLGIGFGLLALVVYHTLL
jgi:hypothetical protein